MNDGNFYRLFEAVRDRDPSAVILELEDGAAFSRQALDALAARYARGLRRAGCLPGDRVAAQLNKSAHALALYLGCLRAGLCYLPFNTACRPAELKYFLDDATPKAFFRESDAENLPGGSLPEDTQLFSLGPNGEGGFAALIEAGDDLPPVVLASTAPAAILYTSGTTGRPKGTIISHRALSSNAETLGALWGFSESDVLLHSLPLFHAHGLFLAFNVALVRGSRVLMHAGFDARAVLAALPHATVFLGVPTYYSRLIASPALTPERCGHMRLFVSGSAPLSADMHRAFEARTGHRVLERYGSTEALILCSNPLVGERRPGSVGPPIPGVELRIANEADEPLPVGEIGMIQVRGPGLFSGYLNMPEQTQAEFTPDGFFRTGDLGKLDEDGYVSITGRAKDLVITGGFNVYPAEVEAVIDALPSVRESAVVGGPHPDFGECVVAFVTANDPADPPSPTEVIQVVRDRLANYKVPKQVFLIDELPRNAMGKVLKNDLRLRLAQAP